MITEDYVSFETAKLLKEKGFDVYVHSYYEKNEHKTKEEFNTNEALWNWNISGFCYSAPTLQMAMKWLREVHKIMISIRLFNSYKPFWEDEPHQFTADIATKSLPSKAGHLRGIYSTYEEAAESAIKYCLENLI